MAIARDLGQRPTIAATRLQPVAVRAEPLDAVDQRSGAQLPALDVCTVGASGLAACPRRATDSVCVLRGQSRLRSGRVRSGRLALADSNNRVVTLRRELSFVFGRRKRSRGRCWQRHRRCNRVAGSLTCLGWPKRPTDDKLPPRPWQDEPHIQAQMDRRACGARARTHARTHAFLHDCGHWVKAHRARADAHGQTQTPSRAQNLQPV